MRLNLDENFQTNQLAHTQIEVNTTRNMAYECVYLPITSESAPERWNTNPNQINETKIINAFE